ncbi:MAG TPA: amino acid adenylation domain-containing protein [Roseiflexaceae bacterium]|nr:amino acid adenylation domain-containing protein [Roseiflexaceae bacterium]
MPDTPIDNLSPEEKRALLAKLRRQRRPQPFPLTSAQQRIWFLEQLTPGTSLYHIPMALRWRGPLQPELLGRSLDELRRRHAILRASFGQEDGQPVQTVQPPAPLPLPLIDLSGLPEAAREDEARRLLRDGAAQPFDLAQGPLLRGLLLRLAPDEHVLGLTVHHLVFDGWSVEILLRDLRAIYDALVAGRAPALPELPIQYLDYALWQRQPDQQAEQERQLAHWRARLAGLQPQTLPLAAARSQADGVAGATVERRLPPALHARLGELARQNGATMFMVLLTAFQVLLARYRGQADVAVATVVANRSRPELEGLIGFFANTLVLRADLSGPITLREALARVRAACLDAFAHQGLPFEQLVAELRPARQLGQTPLAEAAFALQQLGAAAPADRTVELELLPGGDTAKYDLALGVTEDAEGLRAAIEYRTALFSPDTAARVLGHWQTLLEAMAADLDRPLADAPLLTEQERRRLLADWNATTASIPAPLVHQRFAAQARATPEAVAVQAGDQRLSYAELEARSNRLAHLLLARGLPPETRVGIAIGRTPALAVALLAALKAGAAYVPLDPSAPPERLAFVLGDAQIGCVLSGPGGASLPETAVPVLDLDALAPDLAGLPDGPPARPVAPEQLAYVLYTSGSTGRPKGVMVSHAGLRNYLAWAVAAYAVAEGAGAPVHSPVGFDLTVTSLFTPLLAGRTVTMLPEAPGVEALAMALLEGNDFSLVKLTPAHVQLLAQSPRAAELAGRARALVIGGEALLAEHLALWRRAAPGVRLINEYGPTETVVGCCVYEVDPDDPSGGVVPIGRPIANTQLYVLDQHMQPVPPGVPGELYIGGDGLARGYLGRPDLTAERFLPNPFGVGGAGGWGLGAGEAQHEDGERKTQNSKLKTQNSRLYRTGDLCRWREDGQLEFLGRIDGQVKLRGFRIELGEIEAVLSEHPLVRATAVALREDTPGVQRLVAYVVPAARPEQESTKDTKDTNGSGQEKPGAQGQDLGADGAELNPHNAKRKTPEGQNSKLNTQHSELRAFLARQLPEYMVPAAFVVLDGLPVSANGKIDRAALPAPEPPRPAATALPQGAVEELIAGVWREVLGLEQVGRQDTFFDLGGHSLLLVKAHARLAALVETPLTLVDLFRFPTVAALAAHLAGTTPAAAPERPTAPVSGAIAIIGMAARFPGAPSVDAFWQQVCDGAELIRFFSEQELADAGVASELLRDPHYVRAAGHLPDSDLFDAGFFGMSPREARLTDPQHRVFLELAWEALEHAGYDPAGAGPIGLFAGAALNGYGRGQSGDDELLSSINSDPDFLATRVSYKLNLTGPSMTVQTACSTSLVATHLACQSLRAGECDLALAGGVSIQQLRASGYLYQEGGILSPDGHCRPFDAAAGGTVGSDGAALVVLKPLERALADGDTVYAVIKGSAVNNDGALKAGFGAPGVAGQARVIAAAQASAGVAPESIGYIEAHGTATPLGDPIEVAALTEVFRAGTAGTGFCALGSVKSNVGHLNTAAGVAGLIKAALAVHHGVLPPSLHFERPNPQIDLDSSPFYVNTALRPWTPAAGPRRAGVSSFGIGGTNAHLVLEQPPAPPAQPAARPCQLLVLSARSEAALEAATDRLAAWLGRNPEADLADVASTHQRGRRAFPWRRWCRAATAAEAAQALAARDPGRVGPPTEARPRSLAFLFPGQGAQYSGMAAGLYASEPLFREQIDACARLLLPHLGIDIRPVIFEEAGTESTKDAKDTNGTGPEKAERRTESQEPDTDNSKLKTQNSKLTATQYAQPALFVVEYALARLLIAWGLAPQALIGHSVGEYVAACLAGVLSLPDALALVALRGRLVQAMPPGAMLAVLCDPQELDGLLGADLSLAAVNGPAECVVAGPQAAIDALTERLAAREIETRPLHTSHAFHSAMLDPAVGPFVEAVGRLALRPPRIPIVSNLTGTWLTDAEATDPAYWGRHLRETVRFAQGVQTLLDDRLLLEVGPGRVLTGLVRRRPDLPAHLLALPTMRHAKEQIADAEALEGALGTLWAAGAPVDWAARWGDEPRRRLALPTYPFERQRFWIEPAPAESAPAQRTGGRAAIDRWFYAPLWAETPPLPQQDAPAAPGAVWLVLADPAGLGQRLAEQARAAGQTACLVWPDRLFGRLGPDEYTLDPTDRRGYDALLDALAERGQRPTHVLHGWCLDGALSAEQTLQRGLQGLLLLLQALSERGPVDGLRILALARGLQPIGAAPAARPEQATVLGFCLAAPLEYPGLRCRLVDVDWSEGDEWALEELAEQLRSEIEVAEQTEAVAYRGGRRWEQRMTPLALPEPDPRRLPLRQGGVYLITGGLGGMGLTFAAALARLVQARLVLVGRRGLPPRADWPAWLAAHPADHPTSAAIRQIQQIEEDGGTVDLHQADVADAAQMRVVVEQTRARHGAIHGVIHTAGVTGGRLIALQSPETLAHTLAPKLGGTLVLADLLRADRPDLFVLCSSLRSITGGVGMLDYAAANAFQDAFAQSARIPGTRLLSVNWDAWSDVGMSAGALRRRAAEDPDGPAQGMTPAEGVQALWRALAGRLPQVAVATDDLAGLIAAERTAALAAPPALAPHQPPEAAPASEDTVEHILLGIWREVLGQPSIGPQDNFFDLGGDSIVGLQVVARAKRFGLRLRPRHILEHPTVARLAELAEREGPAAEQRALSGPVPLTPVQQWFWELPLRQRQHWNQALVFATAPGLDPALLGRALQHLPAQHDALRIRFVQTESGWQQICAASASLPLRVHDCAGLPADAWPAEIERVAAETQASLNLGEAPLARAVFFAPPPGLPGRLLLVLHHLIVDTVSWRIIAEDLQTAYGQLSRREPVRLPARTVPFGLWAERLRAYAASPELLRELPLWQEQGRTPLARLPRDLPGGNAVAEVAVVQAALDARDTEALIHDLVVQSRVQPYELLIAALGRTLGAWARSRAVWVALEGHGREDLFADVDLSRTVGWFTSLVPVCLPGSEHTPDQSLRLVRERVAALPNSGLGFGVLRYLSPDPAVREQLARLPQPEVSFLYVGREDQPDAPGDALLTPTAEPVGPIQGPEDQRAMLLEISCGVAGGRLHCTWRYSTAIHRPATIGRLAEQFLDAVRTLTRDGLSAPRSYTRTDFPHANLNQEELDDLIAQLSDE